MGRPHNIAHSSCNMQKRKHVAIHQYLVVTGFLTLFCLLVAYEHARAPDKSDLTWVKIKITVAPPAVAPKQQEHAADPQRQPQQREQQQQVLTGPVVRGLEQYVPAVLSDMLVCITFKWSPAKLVYLMTVLQTVASYRTDVDTIIVTDQANILSTALHSIGQATSLKHLEVWQPQTPSSNNTYWLTYEHRRAVEHKLQEKDYSTVLYMEDDTYITWPVIVSWALDTQVLQPLNFTRCFFRTEIHHITGLKVLLDWELKENVTSMQAIDVKTLTPLSNAAYNMLHQQIAGKGCGYYPSGTSQPCNASLHRFFVSPTYPFQGMWIMTKQQLQEFMQHPYWTQAGSVAANLGKHRYWGYPERSNSVNLFLHVPHGYATNCMVPYVLPEPAAEQVQGSNPLLSRLGFKRGRRSPQTILPKLPAVAEVGHLNGYGRYDCIPDSASRAKCPLKAPNIGHFALSSVPADEAFVR